MQIKYFKIIPVLLLIMIIILIYDKEGKGQKKSVKSICEISSKGRQCPQDVEKVFLPRSFPANGIYVGFSNNKVHIEFLDSLVAQVLQLEEKPRINILIPRLEDYEAYDSLKKYFDNSEYDFVNFIPTSSNETVWAQDYLEIIFNTKSGQSEFVDLPYYEREGESIPTSMALACQKNLISQADFKDGFKPGNGEYGGNIEPITSKILVVGNNLSDETYSKLEQITTQKIIDVDVQWLEIGHTEEQLKEKGINPKKGSFPFKALGRARASNESDGLIKVLADPKTDEILGVHMIGPRCADLIAEAVLAMEFRASAEDIARTSHAHPTYTEAFKEACLAATENRALHI